jgi:hypothetical protein
MNRYGFDEPKRPPRPWVAGLIAFVVIVLIVAFAA